MTAVDDMANQSQLAKPVVDQLHSLATVEQRSGFFSRLKDDFSGPLVVDSRVRVTSPKQANDRLSFVLLFAAIAWDRAAPSSFAWGEQGIMAAVAHDAAVLIVQAEFVLVYKLESDAPLPGDQLQAFAMLNGQFNANPFWREFLLSASTRARLPEIIAPLLTL